MTTSSARDTRLRAFSAWAVAEQSHALDLKQRGKLRWVADDDDCPDTMRLAALLEEAGEVGRAVHDGDQDNLRTELVQLAGVALAWASVVR